MEQPRRDGASQRTALWHGISDFFGVLVGKNATLVDGTRALCNAKKRSKQSRSNRSGLGLCLLIGCLPLSGILSCRTLDSFETSPTGAYCGKIVGASFVREGFDRELALEFKLDLQNLNSVPGYLTSADSDIGPCAPAPLFAAAPLRAPRKVESDALSALSFGDSALHTFLAWADSTCQGTFLVVASLMQDRSVELRVLQGRLDSSGTEAGPFGLFKLKRSETACWERR
jgi:hypothetical protein